MTIRQSLSDSSGDAMALGRDIAVARRVAATAEATACQARELSERYRAEQEVQLDGIQRVVDRHSTVLEEHTAQLRAIRSSGDSTRVTTKVVTALTALATAIAAYLAASKPSAEDERKAVSAVVSQTVDGTRGDMKAFIAETVRELREDDKRKEEAAMVEVRRMLARIERESAPQRDPDEGATRARKVLGE